MEFSEPKKTEFSKEELLALQEVVIFSTKIYI